MVAPYAPIQNVVPWTQSIAGLNQYVYSTNWTANDSSDVLVYSRLPGVPTSDTLQLVDSSNYTVQFIGSGNIVQVTFIVLHNPPQYNIVTIMRDTPSDFLNLYTNTNFTPSMLNSDFETLVQVDQQNQLYWQQIVPRYNNSATVNVPIDTILPVLKANEFWIKNSSNTAFIAATVSGGGSEFPVNGPFILYSADSNYPEGFNLGSLASGFLAQNSALSVSTPYVIPIPIDVAHGGTGKTSINPFAVLVGGATSTSAIVPVSDLGTIGQVLTSSGPGLPPSYQDVPPTPSAEVVPIGTIITFAGPNAVSDYLSCDGTSYSTTTYSTLFNVIGYTWGGSGANFNVPNLPRHVLMGSGGSGSAIISNTVGSVGGEEAHTMTVPELAAHTHTLGGNFNQGATGGSVIIGGLNQSTGSTGSSTPFNVIQPSAIVQMLIKYQ